MCDGVLLYNDIERKCYNVLIFDEQNQGLFTGEVIDLMDKETIDIPYGMLLMHIVSLNVRFFDYIIEFLKHEFEVVKANREHWDFNDKGLRGYAKGEIVLRFCENMQKHEQLFEMIEQQHMQIDYFILIVDIFLSEMTKIYTTDLTEINDISEFLPNIKTGRDIIDKMTKRHTDDKKGIKDFSELLPDILLHSEMREELKDFLCSINIEKNYPIEFFSKYVNGRLIKKKHVIGENGAILEAFVVSTFEEAIAIEVLNLYKYRSKIVGYSRCKVCGCLFRRRPGKISEVCYYLNNNGLTCQELLGENSYAAKVRNRLKALINLRGYQEISSKIYKKFDEKILEAVKQTTNHNMIEEVIDKIYEDIVEEAKAEKKKTG